MLSHYRSDVDIATVDSGGDEGIRALGQFDVAVPGDHHAAVDADAVEDASEHGGGHGGAGVDCEAGGGLGDDVGDAEAVGEIRGLRLGWLGTVYGG